MYLPEWPLLAWRRALGASPAHPGCCADPWPDEEDFQPQAGCQEPVTGAGEHHAKG